MLRYLLKGTREGLGGLIILFDHLTRSKPLHRSTTQQDLVNEATKSLSLYQFHACPFCIKTRRALHRLNLSIELRDAQNDQNHRQQLQSEGGAIQVPCLRVEQHHQARWLYESAEIIRYLEGRFGEAAPS